VTDTGATDRPRTSTRDRDDLRRRLVAWLATKVDNPEVDDLVAPDTTGMSSETLLFTARWREGGDCIAQPCATRLAPSADALPVFPVYDLERQYRIMTLVGERTDVPVPRTLWYEDDPAALGTPFFVMERIDGIVPPDIMPYTFGSWLLDAAPEDQARLQAASVALIAGVHTVDPDEAAFLRLDRPGATPLRRHVADLHAYYDWVAADAERMPLLERGFGWLEDHWPDEGPEVVSWGDARPGNVIYRDFTPVAVLDWEMAATGPPEADLGWMAFLHRFFQDLTEQVGLPGMPGFMRAADLAATYESLTGYTPRDLEWFMLYAALRHGAIMSRIACRAAHFGEREMPDDPDDLIMHRTTIEQMLDGSYWSRL
jgi:aminoglycoside phosphotransferase (APT) family kinase protein